MIRSDKIKSQLFGEVGFRQSTLTGYDIVDASNQVSRSGLFFQDASRLVTIKNIKETQENVDTDLISRKHKKRRELIKFAIERVTKQTHEEE